MSGSGSQNGGDGDSHNANYGPLATDGALMTAARDDDHSRLIKNHDKNHDQFENDDNVSEILKKMKWGNTIKNKES